MINCPFQKKYEEEILREEKLAIEFRSMSGVHNLHADRVQQLMSSLHKLSIDHRLGGCICQAARPIKHLRL